MYDNARIWLVIHINNTLCNFLQNLLLNPIFFLAHRNRYLERTDDGQKNPRGLPNFNSYVKIYLFLDSGQTDRGMDGQTDRWAETLIWVVLPNLLVPPGAPAAHGLEELGFSSPFKHRGCMVIQEFGW